MIHETIATSTMASRKPTSGDSTMAATVFDKAAPDRGRHPAFAMPAPTSPPISACELLTTGCQAPR